MIDGERVSLIPIAMLLKYHRFSIVIAFFTHDSIYAKRVYAMAIPSVRLSVCLSVRLSHGWMSKTVEARITQFSPYSSPIPLVFGGKFHPEILRGSPPSGGLKQRRGG